MRAYCLPILLLCLFFTSATVAQQVVNGTITSAKGSPIPFAYAMLRQLPDSGIIRTTVADSEGNYRIEAPKQKQLLITIAATGYISVSKNIDPILPSQQIDISLAQDNTLNEVTVSSKKPLIEHKIDRVIFNVENSITAIGGDALDAIGKAPGVHVNGTEGISLAGKSTVSLMIDDKLMELGGEELAEVLHSIPSENIARIEVITAPPAKYDAAGNSGMINIVTKKRKQQGLNGSVTGNLAQNSLTSARGAGAFNYRKDKLNIYGNTSFGDNYSKPIERQTAFYPDEQWNQVNHVDNLNNYHYSQLGADYDINPRSVIGILYTYAGSTPKMIEHINGTWAGAGNSIDSFVNTSAHDANFGERNVVNLNYVWKIDSTGKKLSTDGDFFTRTGRMVRDFTTNDLLTDGTPTGINSTDRSTGEQVLYIGSVKADMELPTPFAKISFGAKASWIHVVSDNVFQYLDTGAYITDPTKTNKFDYHENTQALYLSVQKKLSKQWDAQAGLRGEYTQTQANSITIAQVNNTQYFKLFPTAYLQYTPNENNVFNLNYNRRIDRPNMLQINPFRRYLTPSSYEEGNPFLQPSYTSNLEFSYTLKSNYTFTTYVQHTTQAASQILDVDTVNKGLYYRYANIGTSTNYGITASAVISPAKWWESNTQFYGFHAHVVANYYNTAVYTQYDQDGFVIENDNTFTLNKQKTLLAECGLMYVSTQIENYNYRFPAFNFNAGIKALFFKRNLIVGFNVNDIFATDVIKTRNLYNGSITNNYYDERGAQLSVTWKFGNKNIKSKRDRNSTLEESKRM